MYSERKRARHKAYLKEKYHNDPEYRAKHLGRVKKNNERREGVVEELFRSFRSGGCLLCPERTECCLVAHHVDPEKKDFQLGRRRRRPPAKVREELEKCVCLCMNCHAKLHAGILSLPGALTY